MKVAIGQHLLIETIEFEDFDEKVLRKFVFECLAVDMNRDYKFLQSCK